MRARCATAVACLTALALSGVADAGDDRDEAAAVVAPPAPAAPPGPAVPPAGAGPATPSRFHLLLDALGSPARRGIVQELLRQPEVRSAEEANVLGNRLRAAGGEAALQGLLALTRHPDARVSKWTLGLVRDLGLRTNRGVDDVRRLLDAPDGEVRVRACWALWVLGDASDVPVLLDMADDPANPAARAALAAVRRLGGLDSRHRSPSAVRAWWDAHREQMLQDLEEALAAVEEGSANGLLDMHRTVLAGRAWMDPALVLDRLREWAMSEEPALRIEAFRLAESLRLADLSDAVGTALVYETDDAALVAAGQAARAIQIALTPAVEARIVRARRRLEAEREAPVEAEEPSPPPSPAPGGR